MNTERYVWPVIIAASLHGALLCSFVDPVVIFPPGKTKATPPETTDDRMQMFTGSPANGNESGGGPAPLLVLPDILPELPKDTTVFTVPIEDKIFFEKPAINLPKTLEGIGEPGNDKGLHQGPRGVTSILNLDRIPRAIVQTSPDYPAAMRKDGASGSVTVEFVVDTMGRVVSAEAVRWSHHEFLDAAVRAVLRWRFEPGTLNGRKVSYRVAIPIEFTAER